MHSLYYFISILRKLILNKILDSLINNFIQKSNRMIKRSKNRKPNTFEIYFEFEKNLNFFDILEIFAS